MQRWFALFFLLAACGPDDPEQTGVCTTGTHWTHGDAESPEMHPGGDCIACHTERGEGPAFVFAGTVFTEYDEEIDCNGAEGVEVVVTDAEGSTWTMVTNGAGNFYLRTRDADPVYPITAVVRDGDSEREMSSGQSDGNCASCHTAAGSGGAPGRVILP